MSPFISRKEARSLGLVRYFTGKPCPREHVAEHLVSNGTCVACLKEKSRERYSPEKASAYHKGWREKHKEELAVYHAGWRKSNSDYKKAQDKKYRENNSEKVKSTLKKCYQERKVRDPEWYAALVLRNEAHRKANPHISRAAVRKRQAVKRQAVPRWADTRAMSEFYRFAKTHGCEVDHEIPLSHRLVCGLHVENNLRALPKEVNQAKSNYFCAEEWGYDLELLEFYRFASPTAPDAAHYSLDLHKPSQS